LPKKIADPIDPSEAITTVPASATSIPKKERDGVLSPKARYARIVTKTGWVHTSTTLAAALV
jgi:hypothetical protein